MKIEVTNGKISKIETCCPEMAEMVCTKHIHVVPNPLKLQLPSDIPATPFPCAPPFTPGPNAVHPVPVPYERQTMEYCYKCGAKIQITVKKMEDANGIH